MLVLKSLAVVVTYGFLVDLFQQFEIVVIEKLEIVETPPEALGKVPHSPKENFVAEKVTATTVISLVVGRRNHRSGFKDSKRIP